MIEKGELLYSSEAQACKDQEHSCVHHNVPGVGLVRIKVLRHYRVSPVEGIPPRRVPRGRFVPPSEVATEGTLSASNRSSTADSEACLICWLQTLLSCWVLRVVVPPALAVDNLLRELEDLLDHEKLRGLFDRAEESLERYPLLGAEHLDDELDRCRDAYEQRLTPEMEEQLVQDLANLIIDLEIVKVPLWASMYDEAGSRLLELLPQHSDAKPEKPVGFGSHRGVSKSRRTTSHMSSAGTGSAAPFSSLHVDPEESQRHVVHNPAEHRAMVSMVKHSARRRRTISGGKQQASRRHGASGAARSFASARDESGDGGRARRSLSGSRAAVAGSLMDKSLFQFLQQNELVGCEQKLQR